MQCVTNGIRRMKRRAADDIALSPDTKAPVIDEAFDDSQDKRGQARPGQARPGQARLGQIHAVVAPLARGIPVSVCGVSIPGAARDPRGENFQALPHQRCLRCHAEKLPCRYRCGWRRRWRYLQQKLPKNSHT